MRRKQEPNILSKGKGYGNILSCDILKLMKADNVKALTMLSQLQNELEQRRSRNQKHYQYKVARIDHMAREATAQAEEKRRTEESRVKEKAKKIRSGEAPFTCFCF